MITHIPRQTLPSAKFVHEHQHSYTTFLCRPFSITLSCAVVLERVRKIRVYKNVVSVHCVLQTSMTEISTCHFKSRMFSFLRPIIPTVKAAVIPNISYCTVLIVPTLLIDFVAHHAACYLK